MSAPMAGATLAYEIEGSGPPIVFLHGLTFDRRTWRPIVERLGRSVQSILIDLPAHGESGGAPAALDAVAAQIHELLEALAIDRPILVGHSMSVGLAFIYAFAYPTRAIVAIDQGLDVRPFAELLHQLEPLLRGPGFAQAWQYFEDSLGLDLIPEPQRSLVLETHRVSQELVIGYQDMLLRADPAEFQASIDKQIAKLDTSCLAVFGRLVTEPERQRFEWLPEFQLEEWLGDGHFVHLVDPDRFTARLRRFIDYCTTPS